LILFQRIDNFGGLDQLIVNLKELVVKDVGYCYDRKSRTNRSDAGKWSFTDLFQKGFVCIGFVDIVAKSAEVVPGSFCALVFGIDEREAEIALGVVIGEYTCFIFIKFFQDFFGVFILELFATTLVESMVGFG